MKTVYYDLETNSQHAPYAAIRRIGILWDEDKQGEIYDWPLKRTELKYLKSIFSSADIRKVGFNCMNFDNLVLCNHNIEVNEINNEDAIFLLKAVYPGAPAYSLKFLCWWLCDDMHWPEFEMINAGFSASQESKYLNAYLNHDLIQHRMIYKKGMEMLADLQEKIGYTDEAYRLDCSVGMPLRQLVFEGGMDIDVDLLNNKIKQLQEERKIWIEEGCKRSGGRVKNVNSTMQMGNYLNEEGFELALSKGGDFSVKKTDLEDIRTNDPVAECGYQVKDIDAGLKFYKNYSAAVKGAQGIRKGWIPQYIAISGAATRRFTSSSYFKINFQNANEKAKEVQLIPKGWLGWYIDSTQVENVVHIYESNGIERRKAYEADENWNEYVWLCCQILGKEYSKEELEKIQSKLVAHWSVYKQYKTVKLALNFGLGVKNFCKTSNLSLAAGRKIYGEIHEACPDILILQNRVASDLTNFGYVQDVFGHIYTGKPEKAYKVVAYLIQGCGTGSLPKAQMRANYDTIIEYNKRFGEQVAVLRGNTHDESSGLIRKDIGETTINEFLRDIMYNMTVRFSPKFDGIPLRAKLKVTDTYASEAKTYKLP